jgi:hypothetical protein
MYEFITWNEHFITINDREGYSNRRKIWNENVLKKALNNQKSSEDIYVTKYPTGKLIKYIILDFDSKEDKGASLKESTRLMNYMQNHGHPCVLVDSTNKGYHLYIKISPFLFEDEGNRTMPNWELFFDEFVRFMLRKSSKLPYTTLDATNTSAGLRGNIRLIGSIHPSTGKKVSIIKGEFSDDLLPPTELQDTAQQVAFEFCNICEEQIQKKMAKTKIVNGIDPIEENDLRELIPDIFGGDVKHYGHYSMMCCPFHNEKHPSLMLTKRTFKCRACGEQGNIWSLKKKGLVEFGVNGEVMY